MGPTCIDPSKNPSIATINRCWGGATLQTEGQRVGGGWKRKKNVPRKRAFTINQLPTVISRGRVNELEPSATYLLSPCLFSNFAKHGFTHLHHVGTWSYSSFSPLLAYFSPPSLSPFRIINGPLPAIGPFSPLGSPPSTPKAWENINDTLNRCHGAERLSPPTISTSKPLPFSFPHPPSLFDDAYSIWYSLDLRPSKYGPIRPILVLRTF
jgi:hypothetical protein